MHLKIGAWFACLAMAFVAPACAVQDSPPAQTESAQSDLNTDEAATNFSCNGFEPGLPVPSRKVLQFEACQADCLAVVPHPSEAACKRTCCVQYTGCNQCFEP